MKRKIPVSKTLFLSPPRAKDALALMAYLNEKEFSRQTISIPYPYTQRHALRFLKETKKRLRNAGRVMDWAIRNARGDLIGMISFQGRLLKRTRKIKIGYWLAKPFWDRGIMTRVLKRFLSFAFQCGYKQLEMMIFESNQASRKVAEKCGFSLEKVSRGAYRKAGQRIPVCRYVLKTVKRV